MDCDDPAPSPEEFLADADLIVHEGLASVAVRALTGRDEHLGTPYLRLFREVAMKAEMRAMAVDVSGAKVVMALAESGVPAAIVKGPAMARLYPQHWPRPYADLDLVVTKDRFLDAIACAQGLGFSYSERAVPQWRWFDLVCREGINLHSAVGGNVDFHHHVPPWTLGTGLSTEGVIQRSSVAQLSGVTVLFADAEDLLVFSALHILNDLWKGKLGLTSWRDVMVIVRNIGEPRARAAFDRAGIPWLFEMLSEELTQLFPTARPETVNPRVVPLGPRLRLATLGWSNQSKSSRHRLAWVSRLPVLNGLAFLAGTAVPSRDYINDRHGSYLNYWRRGWQETLSTAHGSDFRMTTVDDYADEPSFGPVEEDARQADLE